MLCTIRNTTTINSSIFMLAYVYCRWGLCEEGGGRCFCLLLRYYTSTCTTTFQVHTSSSFLLLTVSTRTFSTQCTYSSVRQPYLVCCTTHDDVKMQKDDEKKKHIFIIQKKISSILTSYPLILLMIITTIMIDSSSLL